jgi:hypothetical protein
MADNRLRCALVYRLDAGDETSVTMLAKYDHASQYETSPGGSDLYGGRDKSYADAVGMVIGNDPPGATSEAGTIGGFKVCQSEVHQVVYGSDTDGLCKFGKNHCSEEKNIFFGVQTPIALGQFC